MIGIVDYGMGNILSVKNALEYIGADVTICARAEEIDDMEKLVLPGVGSFGDCMNNLKELGFIKALNKAVMIEKKPILGICLGMQVMAAKGYEGGQFDGLGWFDAEVVRLDPENKKFRVPHVGWNDVTLKMDSMLFEGIPETADLYFVHSYYMKCRDKSDILAEFDYSGSFTAAVAKNNIVATQFHPEKSQDHGLTMLRNFDAWKF